MYYSVDKFVNARLGQNTRRAVVQKYSDMSDAASAPQKEVDRAVDTILNAFLQDTARVLQERILDRLESRHGFVRAELAEWVQEVSACEQAWYLRARVRKEEKIQEYTPSQLTSSSWVNSKRP